jgi:hypothetical protein
MSIKVPISHPHEEARWAHVGIFEFHAKETDIVGDLNSKPFGKAVLTNNGRNLAPNQWPRNFVDVLQQCIPEIQAIHGALGYVFAKLIEHL